MPTVRSVIQQLRTGHADENCWLYITGEEKDLTLESEADLGVPECSEETGEEIHPPAFGARGLRLTIDVDTVISCIQWADRISGIADDQAAADVIRYYIRFDAWPETLNAPDPPPAAESLRLADRKFCDALGDEDSTRPCRREGCPRGAISLGVLCRRHHFEALCNRPFPFDD